ARPDEAKPASLDDLKKLNIICFVPAYLPKDFKLKNAKIIYEDDPNEGHQGQKVVTYAIEWSNSRNASFSIDSSWAGIGDPNMTVAEFSKIVTSLHPIKGDAKTASAPPPLKLHPKIFNMIDCWISDSESPVVTEINLDAVEMNKNEFDMDNVKADGEWTRAKT